MTTTHETNVTPNNYGHAVGWCPADGLGFRPNRPRSAGELAVESRIRQDHQRYGHCASWAAPCGACAARRDRSY